MLGLDDILQLIISFYALLDFIWISLQRITTHVVTLRNDVYIFLLETLINKRTSHNFLWEDNP